MNCENCGNDPSIGQCLQVTNTSIQVQWMQGTYTSRWITWMVNDTQNRRKKVPWTDWVPKASIILFDFELTPTSKLKKSTVSYLKLKYNELRA